MEAARLMRETVVQCVSDPFSPGGKRAYTKRVIAETTEEAYEVVCGVAGCVLRRLEERAVVCAASQADLELQAWESLASLS